MHSLAIDDRERTVIKFLQCISPAVSFIDLFKFSLAYYTLPVGKIACVIYLETNFRVLPHDIDLHAFERVRIHVGCIIHITDRHYIGHTVSMATDMPYQL